MAAFYERENIFELLPVIRRLVRRDFNVAKSLFHSAVNGCDGFPRVTHAVKFRLTHAA